MNLAETLGSFVGFILTLCVFSYILADNFLFRLAVHLLIGVAAGLGVVLVVYNLIWPQLLTPLLVGSGEERLLALIPLILSLLLLAKAFQRVAFLGNPVMAFLVGVGAAAAIGGAVTGTLFPQTLASINLFDFRQASPTPGQGLIRLVNAVIILVGTIATLAYFNFGVKAAPGMRPKRPFGLSGLATLGQVFIAVTFGVVFAGVYSSALAALIERLYQVIQFILSLLFPGG